MQLFQQQCPPCSTGMGHPLGMAPCAEAPHPVGFIRSVGFYPSLASTFPAHYCPLHGLVSFLRAITLSSCIKINYLYCYLDDIHCSWTITTLCTNLTHLNYEVLLLLQILCHIMILVLQNTDQSFGNRKKIQHLAVNAIKSASVCGCKV